MVDHDDNALLTTGQVLELVEQVTGKKLSAEAWRKYLSEQRNADPADPPANPVPDPVPFEELPAELATDRRRRYWRAGGVRVWAEKRGGTRTLPKIPGLWDVTECAAAVGISRGAWENAVAQKTITNPAPDPVPPSEVPAKQRWRRFWRPEEVLEWAANRPGYGNWQPRMLDESQLKPNEWLAPRCAEEAGVTVDTWLRWVHDGDAPAWKRKAQGRWLVWAAPEVRRYLRRKTG